MKTLTLTDDLKIFTVTAESYPDGIFPAFKKLHAMVPFTTERHYISISKPEEGLGIVYRAGATETSQDELNHLNLDSYIIKKGTYAYIDLSDYRNDLSKIGSSFQQLITLKNIDPLSYCVEWYTTENDMKCMVKLMEE